MSESQPSLVYVSDATEFGGAEVYIRLLTGQLPSEYSVLLVARPEFEEKFNLEGGNVTYVHLPQSLVDWYRFCRQHRNLIFHFNLSHYGSCRWYSFMAHLAGVRLTVGTLHTLINESRTKHWHPKSVLARQFFRSYDKIICPSQYVGSTLVDQRSFPKQRVVVIHNGILQQNIETTTRQSLQVAESSFLIVAVGRMHIEKGFDYLIRAVAKLPLSTHLVLVGDGEYLEQFKDLAKELQIESRVTFTGYRQDSMSIIKAADALVLPSYFENFPYVILEAMMLGVPVVASNVGGIPEQVINNQTGILVEPRSVESLVRALKQLIDDPTQTAAMSKAAQDYFQGNFSLEKSVEQTLSAYGTLGVRNDTVDT